MMTIGMSLLEALQLLLMAERSQIMISQIELAMLQFLVLSRASPPIHLTPS